MSNAHQSYLVTCFLRSVLMYMKMVKNKISVVFSYKPLYEFAKLSISKFTSLVVSDINHMTFECILGLLTATALFIVVTVCSTRLSQPKCICSPNNRIGWHEWSSILWLTTSGFCIKLLANHCFYFKNGMCVLGSNFHRHRHIPMWTNDLWENILFTQVWEKIV